PRQRRRRRWARDSRGQPLPRRPRPAPSEYSRRTGPCCAWAARRRPGPWPGTATARARRMATAATAPAATHAGPTRPTAASPERPAGRSSRARVEARTLPTCVGRASGAAGVVRQSLVEQVARGRHALVEGEAVEHVHQLAERGAARVAAGGVAAGGRQPGDEAVVQHHPGGGGGLERLHAD